jgi:hypothetical protein
MESQNGESAIALSDKERTFILAARERGCEFRINPFGNPWLFWPEPQEENCEHEQLQKGGPDESR